MNWSLERTNFDRNIAVIIGINNYQNGIDPLKTAVNDAKAIANLLEQKYEYQQVIRLFPNHQEGTLAELNQLLFETLPKKIKPTEGDRLLFYFAGHGIARNSEDGPAGAIIPQDAHSGKWETYLPMKKLNEALSQLECHHLLVVLDCCFAGNFRWSSHRNVIPELETIHREHYDRFIRYPAWQAITSAAHNQEALDYTDQRGIDPSSQHSPFAKALINGLKDMKADSTGDGVITAPELYLHLRDGLIGKDGLSELQTAGLWPLQKHDRGEFIFTLPGFVPEQLKPAPPLDASKNPYRGLESFDEEHSELFFGRTELVKKLQDFVKTHALSVVLGASGSGKSSLVKAGLIPKLRKETTEEWYILPPIRPGETPLQALNNGLKNSKFPEIKQQNPQQNLAKSIDIWAKNNPNSKLLLLIDQSEEIITLCQNEDERQQFFQQILTAIDAHRDKLRVVLTLRSDFEPQIRDAGIEFIPEGYSVKNTELKHRWQDGRFIVPAMTRGELREVIEKPAEVRVMFFEPEELVEQLIDEVADMPGALPLLSFALSELYLKYLKRQRQKEIERDFLKRTMTQSDYQDLGGVMQSLTKRADEEYDSLVNQNSAYRQVIRHVMLRMVAIGGGELARRRVPLSELEYPPEKNGLVKEVIERFTKARLLVRGKDADENSYVEPAHDALVRGWKQLLEWKQEDEEGLVLQRRLTPAAEDWKKQRQVRFLWHNNPRLDLLKKVSKSDDNWLNQLEAGFVQRSVRRKNFNTRRNWSVAIAVILGLGTGLVFSLIGQRNALIEGVRVSQQSAEVSLQLGQELDALLASLRAAKTLKTEWLLQLLKPNAKLQNEAKGTLRTIVYRIKEINQWKGIKPYGSKIAFNSQGNIMLAKRDENDNITLLNLSNDSEISLEGHGGNAGANSGIAFNQDGNLFATADQEGKIRLWNSKGEKIKEFSDNLSKSVYKKLFFSLDSKQLGIVAYSLKGSVRRLDLENVSLWDISGSQPKEIKPDQDFFYRGVGFNANNDLVIAHRDRGNFLRLYNFETGKQLGKISGNFEGNFLFSNTISLVFNYHNNKLIIFGKLADLQTEDFIYKGYTKETISATNFSPSGKETAKINDNGVISIMDLEGRLLFELKRHLGSVSQIVFNPNGNQLASIGTDNTVRLWNLGENKQLVEVKIKPEKIDRIEFSKHKEYTIRGQPDRNNQISIYVEDKSSGNLIFVTSPIERLLGVYGSSLSPDGMLLASTHKDGLRLWDSSGRQLLLLKLNHDESYIKEIDFSADGKLLVAKKDDGTVKLWEIEGLDELREKGCNWVRDYLENNPNVDESDRRLCDGVTQPKQVASPIYTINSPNSSTLSNQSPSIYIGNDYTITITGIGKNASYKGCDQKNQCIEIAQTSDYQDGRYIWKNGNYQYKMSPLDNGNYQLEVIDPNGKVILNVSVRPNP